MKKLRKLRKNANVAANNIMAYGCYTKCQCEIRCTSGSVAMHDATIGSTTVNA